MSGKIKIDDFFESGYEARLQAITQAWQSLANILGSSLDEIKNVAEAMKAQSKSTDKSSKTLSEQERLAKRLRNSQEALWQSLTSTNQEIRQNTIAARDNNRQTDLNIKLNNSLDGSYNKISAQLSLNKIRIKELGDALGANGAKFKELAKEIDIAEEQLKQMDRTMNVHKRNVGNYASGLKGAIGVVKRFAATYLGFEAMRSAIRTTKELTVQTDSLRLAYSKIIPDSEKLAKTNQFLRQTAENYGIDLNSLRKNYLRFTAASKSSNLTMEQTQGIFNSVAKAGSVMGLEAIRMDRAFNALEQMLSKGKVSSEELRQQLGDSLPGSMEIMADALNVTTLQLSKMLEEGTVLSEDALPKFAKQLEKTYGIENLSRVDNLTAAQGRLKTAVIELVEAMEAEGVIKGFYGTMTNGVKFITENMVAVKNLASALILLGIAYGGLKLGNFISSIKLATVSMNLFNIAIKANSLSLLITSLTTIAGLWTLYGDKLVRVTDRQKAATKAQKDFNDELKRAIELNEKRDDEDKKDISEVRQETAELYKRAKVEEFRNKIKEKELLLAAQKKALEEQGDLGTLRAIFGGEGVIGSDIKKTEREIDLLKQGLAAVFGEVDDELGIDWTTGIVDKKKKKKEEEELEKAKAAAFKKEKAIIDTMKDGFEKKKRLLKLQRDEEAFEWRKHKDLLILIEEKYQRELADLIESDKFEARERSINAMQDGFLKELALLNLKHDKEDAELKKHGDDVTKNDAKHYAERLAFLHGYYSTKKKADEADQKRLIEEFKTKQAIDIEKDRLAGATKFDEEFMERKRKIELLEYELSIRTDLTDSERKLMELQKQNLENWYETRDAFLDFLKTTQGGSVLQAVLGPMGGAMLQGQLQGKKFKGEKVKKADEIKAPKVFGKGVDELFGLENQAQVDALVDGFKLAKDAMTDYYQTAIQLANQLIQTRRQEVQSAEKNLQNEIANRNAGRANFIDDAQARLEAAKEAEEEAIKNRQKLQEEKLVMDTVTQASNLITGVSEIWKVYAAQPWLAAALTAGMFGTFAISKVKAFEATRQEFAEGDLSIIGGGRHGSGKDTLVGYEGNKAQFAERGEARMILSRRATARYAEILPSLFEQLSNGTFDADRMIGRNAHISQSPIIFNADMSDTNNELSRIRKQGEEREYAHSDRTIIKRGRFKQILRH